MTTNEFHIIDHDMGSARRLYHQGVHGLTNIQWLRTRVLNEVADLDASRKPLIRWQIRNVHSNKTQSGVTAIHFDIDVA